MPRITFTITADTVEAQKQVTAFFQNLSSAGASAGASGSAINKMGREGAEQLHQLREASMLTKEGFHGLEASVLLLGGERFETLGRGLMAARMGMMTLRSAAELTGVTLAKLALPFGVIAAAVYGGIALWQQWGKAAEYAEKQAKAADDAALKWTQRFSEIPKGLAQIQDLVKSGLLPAAEASAALGEIGLVPRSSARQKLPLNQSAADASNNLSALGGGRQARLADFEEAAPAPAAPTVTAPSSADALEFNLAALRGYQAKLVQRGLLVQGGTDKEPTIENQTQIDALIKIQDLKRRINEEGLTGIAKEKAKAKDEYDTIIEQLKTLVRTAGPRVAQAGLDVGLLKLTAAENYGIKVQDIEEKGRKEAEQGHRIEMAKQAKEAEESLEREITLSQEQEGDKRGQNYQAEFDKRVTLYEALVRDGKVTEDEYTALVQEATIKRIAGWRREVEETIKLRDQQNAEDLAAIEQRIRLVESSQVPELQRKHELLTLLKEEYVLLVKLIESYKVMAADPNLTPDERSAAGKRMTALQGKLGQTGGQMQKTAETGTFTGEFKSAAIQLQNQWGSIAKQMATSFSTVFNAAISDISRGITGLIMGTETWSQALRQIGTSIMTTVVQSIVEMGVRFVATHIVMNGAMMLSSSIASALHTKSVAEDEETLVVGAQAGIGQSAAQGGWIGVLVYLGVLAAALGATAGMARGFATGGRPPVGQMSMVGERGRELFVPDQPGTILPNSVTESLLRDSAAGTGGRSRPNMPHINQNFAILDDTSKVPNWTRSVEGEAWIIDVARRNWHKLT